MEVPRTRKSGEGGRTLSGLWEAVAQACRILGITVTLPASEAGLELPPLQIIKIFLTAQIVSIAIGTAIQGRSKASAGKAIYFRTQQYCENPLEWF